MRLAAPLPLPAPSTLAGEAPQHGFQLPELVEIITAAIARSACSTRHCGRMPTVEAEAQARGLLTTTKLAAVLRPQHVVNIKDSASVDQTLRVRAAAVATVAAPAFAAAGGTAATALP